MPWTPAQVAAVEGHPNHVNAVILDSLYWTALGDPSNPCAGDRGKRGVDQRPTLPWRAYPDPKGNVIYGGASLGPAPAGSGGGWSSPAFGSWLAG